MSVVGIRFSVCDTVWNYDSLSGLAGRLVVRGTETAIACHCILAVRLCGRFCPNVPRFKMRFKSRVGYTNHNLHRKIAVCFSIHKSIVLLACLANHAVHVCLGS